MASLTFALLLLAVCIAKRWGTARVAKNKRRAQAQQWGEEMLAQINTILASQREARTTKVMILKSHSNK